MKNDKEFKKGDIVIVNFGENVGAEKSGVRPAAVLSNNLINSSSDNIIVAPLTKHSHKLKNDKVILYPWQIFLSNKYYKNLEFSSVLQLEDIRSISKRRVYGKIEVLSKENLRELDNKVKVLFGIA